MCRIEAVHWKEKLRGPRGVPRARDPKIDLDVLKNREERIQAFLSDHMPFEWLPVDVLWPMTPRMAHLLHEADILTIPDLLGSTMARLLRIQGFSRRYVKELNRLLSPFDSELEQGVYSYARFFSIYDLRERPQP